MVREQPKNVEAKKELKKFIIENNTHVAKLFVDGRMNWYNINYFVLLLIF